MGLSLMYLVLKSFGAGFARSDKLLLAFTRTVIVGSRHQRLIAIFFTLMALIEL
jgi:hypothetical protein